MNDEFLTPAEIAEILKIKKNTVYEMIKRGDIRANKLGKQLRISREDLDAYLQTQATMPPAAPATTYNPAPKQPITTSSAQGSDHISTIIICGKDAILDRICDKLNAQNTDTNILRSPKGSYNALFALYNKQVHIATAHLWDADTDTYNVTYLPRLLPGMSVRLFHIVNRVQGFYVKSGNPKNITSFDDFKRDDILFANREKGCGTRILLDEKLRELKISKKNIKGYFNERTSHLDCATAIALGNADFALGSERAAFEFRNIDFIPLQTESYDMIIPSQYVNKPHYQKIINLLRDDSFRKEIDAMGGYDVTNMGKEISLL